ncbi:MAG: tRNA (adenosine(37)-N6)-threonylcarbamoyltransferase complex ATPase subunit type 1 TsaE [Verrucomicrobiae bacterium]
MANRIPHCDEIFSGILCVTEADTRALGRRVGEAAHRPLALSLEGPLGAGKTCFVQGLAEGLGLDASEVSSPTFPLVHEYPGGRHPLVHFDLYRLEQEEELVPLGFDEYLQAPGICAIEWGGKFPRLLPSGTWRVQFSIVPAGRRIQAAVVP